MNNFKATKYLIQADDQIQQFRQRYIGNKWFIPFVGSVHNITGDLSSLKTLNFKYVYYKLSYGYVNSTACTVNNMPKEFYKRHNLNYDLIITINESKNMTSARKAVQRQIKNIKNICPDFIPDEHYEVKEYKPEFLIIPHSAVFNQKAKPYVFCLKVDLINNNVLCVDEVLEYNEHLKKFRTAYDNKAVYTEDELTEMNKKLYL